MRFQLKNSNIFKMPGNKHMLHLATIGMGHREFIAMYCASGVKAGNVYIEEVVLVSSDFSKDVFAYSKFIEEDDLAHDLTRFAEEKKITDMKLITEMLFSTGRGSWLTGL